VVLPLPVLLPLPLLLLLVAPLLPWPDMAAVVPSTSLALHNPYNNHTEEIKLTLNFGSLAPVLSRGITRVKLLNLPVPQFPHWWNGYEDPPPTVDLN
jgi:hypothetical protein